MAGQPIILAGSNQSSSFTAPSQSMGRDPVESVGRETSRLLIQAAQKSAGGGPARVSDGNYIDDMRRSFKHFYCNLLLPEIYLSPSGQILKRPGPIIKNVILFLIFRKPKAGGRPASCFIRANPIFWAADAKSNKLQFGSSQRSFLSSLVASSFLALLIRQY